MNFVGNNKSMFEERENDTEEKKNVDQSAKKSKEKTVPKLNMLGESYQDNYRSLSSLTRSGGSTTVTSKYVSSGTDSFSFMQSKQSFNSTSQNNFELLPMPEFGKMSNSSKEKDVEMIDVCEQDMEECGMAPCPSFVPCALLEELDEDMQLIIPNTTIIMELEETETETETETEIDTEIEERKMGSVSPKETLVGLRIDDTNCVVSNDLKECIRLVPLALACVSNDIDLTLLPTTNVLHENNDYDKRQQFNQQIPHIEGCVLLAHKSVTFAVHFYQYPDEIHATLIEFQRRSGDVFIFQKFYEKCLEQLKKIMTNLRNCNGDSNSNSSTVTNGWNNLSSLDDMMIDELSDSCPWNKDCLDLLTDLIQENSQEAVDMLGDLCEQMEKYETLRMQVSAHKQLMKQIMTRVLTHQDQCLVRLGLVALDVIFRNQNNVFIKHALQSQPILAFVIALLDCSSVFVMRRAVRLLSLLADQCGCAWKLNESQKKVLIDFIPRVQYILLEKNSWSSTYATDSFITQDMFQSIAQHLKL